MWICPRCNFENREANVACESCGAARSVGRFGSAPPRRPSAPPSPRVSSAPSRETREQEFARPFTPKEYATPDMDARPKPVRKPCGLARCVGVLLCVLLPALVGLLAWRQYDALSEALLPLYLTEKAPDWLRSVFYGMLTAAAVLLSMLPGLWTILLSRKPPRQG